MLHVVIAAAAAVREARVKTLNDYQRARNVHNILIRKHGREERSFLAAEFQVASSSCHPLRRQMDSSDLDPL